ncbi:MAG: hypothetical protein GEV28_18860 [Actinophytocola sp.]|nr:hypothetical protein [Actinophytocola sp.]
MLLLSASGLLGWRDASVAAPLGAGHSHLPSDPFTLGVASGDPCSESVVLWTRLALEPLTEDGLGGCPGVTRRSSGRSPRMSGSGTSSEPGPAPRGRLSQRVTN